MPDPSSRSGWRWGQLAEVRHVLYRLPAVLAVPGSGCVFVTEGEKDVHALEAVGEVATCNPGGAGKWRPEYAEPLAGRDVLIVADRDGPGRDHAWAVLTSVRPVARFAWIVQAASGKDAADHLAAGLAVTDLVWWEL
jgi:DNA primase